MTKTHDPREFPFSRDGDLGKQTFEELQKALAFYAFAGNKYTVENIVKQMASRRGMTFAGMRAAINRGEF